MAHDTGLESLDTNKLRNRVEEQEDYVETVADFIRDATLEYGEITSQTEGAYGYKTRWRLDRFHGFDLQFYSTLHNQYTLYSDGRAILRIWETEDSFSVETYGDGEWQEKFDEFVEDPEEAKQAYEVDQEADELVQQMEAAMQQQRNKRQQERENLLEDAERLGLR